MFLYIQLLFLCVTKRIVTSFLLQISLKSRLYLHPIKGPTTSDHLILLSLEIVVEPSPIRSLAADYPIFIIFKHSHLIIFHIYVVVYKALRVSQQLKIFITYIFLYKRTNYLSLIDQSTVVERPANIPFRWKFINIAN